LETAPRPELQRSQVGAIDANVHSQRTPVACEIKPRAQKHCTESLVLQPRQEIQMDVRREFARDVRRRPLRMMNHSMALLVCRPIAGPSLGIEVLLPQTGPPLAFEPRFPDLCVGDANGKSGDSAIIFDDKSEIGLEACAEAVRLDFRKLSRDQGWFLAIFVVKIALGLFVFVFKPWLGVVFLVAYGAYFWKEVRQEQADNEGDLEPLKFTPKRTTPPTSAAVIQTGLALIVIFGASHVFVRQLDALGPALGIKPQVLALLLSPIATELPEILNAVIWVRQGKYRLALANISGAMMIQATVPTAFGLFFTPWLLDQSLLIGGAMTTLAVGAMFLAFRVGVITRLLLTSMAISIWPSLAF
jgi:Ca2+/Na+ antiporter